MVDQVRMVLLNFGLKLILMMEAFIASHNKSLELYPVATQAAEMLKKFNELREYHKENFPYLKLNPLDKADELNHRNYPDLYYAAISTAIHEKALGIERRYKMTDVQTTLSKPTIEEYADKKPRKGRKMDQKNKEILKEIGYPLEEEETRITKKKNPITRQMRNHGMTGEKMIEEKQLTIVYYKGC